MYKKSAVPGISHDVFISYAWVDNQQADPSRPGWISQFETDLQMSLDEKVGDREVIRLWRDPKMGGNVDLTEHLAETSQRSALFLAIFSPGFMMSEWCVEKELKGFLRRVGTGGAVVNGITRVLRVDLRPLPQEAQQLLQQDELLRMCLFNSAGYRFHTLERSGERPRILRRTARFIEEDQSYWVEVDKLAEGIIASLLTLKLIVPYSAAAPAAPPASPPPVSPPVPPARPPKPAPEDELSFPVADGLLPPGSVVYLAQAADDVDHARESLAAELTKRGMVVVPQGPLPMEQGAFERAVSGLLSGELAPDGTRAAEPRPVRLAVHVFGCYYGLRVAGTNRSVAELQYHLVRDYFGKHGRGKQLVWIPGAESANSTAQTQQDLLKSVQEPSEPPVPEVFQADFESFRGELIGRLQPLDHGQPPRTKSYRPRVCVAFRPGDASLAREINGVLTQHELKPVSLLGLEDAPDNPDEMDYFNQQVALSDGVLIIYDQGDPKWVKKRIISALDIADERPKNPLSGGIYECPPANRPPVGVTIDGWFILNCRMGHALQKLEPFARQVHLRG